MGLGLFGGGVGAARYLIGSGAHVTVTDLREADQLAPSLAELEGLDLRLALGGHDPADFREADLVVASPAVPRSSDLLRLAESSGVPVASPMNLFLAQCPATVVAVTGSNGKSTTTALLAAALEKGPRRTWLGGNIGISLLPRLGEIGVGDLVVLELSSFQLEDSAWLEWSPHVAVVTNISPNHLDRHVSMDEYAAAKRSIVRFQHGGDLAVLNACDPRLRAWVAEGLRSRAVLFSCDGASAPADLGLTLDGDDIVWQGAVGRQTVCSRSDIPVPGLHNVANVMAAAGGALCAGARPEHVREAVREFIPLEHRLEPAGWVGSLAFYNDSNSTTPASGIAAVSSFDGPVTLIAGGYDKKVDMRPLARAAAESARVFITMGQTGPGLAAMAREEGAGLGRRLIVREAADLPDAVDLAVALSDSGSSVVFSPGCASYDMFENFAHRGRVFKELVAAHAALDRRAGA
jgi:UDP-N-acetylmuramoylalanine--D-glutamate ligase